MLILQDLPDGAAEPPRQLHHGTDPGRPARAGMPARDHHRKRPPSSRPAAPNSWSSSSTPVPRHARSSTGTCRHCCSGTGVSRDAILGWPDVSTLLDAQLGPDCSLADAARLATMLFRARDEPETAAARVRGQMTEYADEKVAQWFRKLDSLKAQCMAISLAVLNGLSREMIAREARMLEDRILPAPDAANAPP